LFSGTLGETFTCFVFDLVIRLSLDLFQSLTIVWIITDITFPVIILLQFMCNPRHTHWEAVKDIICYLKGTAKLKLTLGGTSAGLEAYVDADWASQLHWLYHIVAWLTHHMERTQAVHHHTFYY
jgi:hypothetical protein